jgi:hypothetical protein
MDSNCSRKIITSSYFILNALIIASDRFCIDFSLYIFHLKLPEVRLTYMLKKNNTVSVRVAGTVMISQGNSKEKVSLIKDSIFGNIIILYQVG